MTKCLIVFPPQWAPFSPHLAPAAIAADIRQQGAECSVLDLNIEFYLDVLNEDYLQNALNKAMDSIEGLKKELQPLIEQGKKPEDYPFDIQVKAKRLLFFNRIKQHRLPEMQRIIKSVKSAVELLHDKSAFYNLVLASNAVSIINNALDIVSFEEYPQELSLYNYKNRSMLLDYEHILNYCSSENLFKRYLRGRMDGIKQAAYSGIGISISSFSQLYAGLTLSKMLKEETNAAIFLGGNHISRITDTLKKTPDFFKTFADYVVLEEGERPVNELIEHIEGKRKINDVSSIMYLNEPGSVIQTEKKDPLPLSKLAIPAPEGFPLEKYLLPEIIMPVQLSRGCYWKKCTFCDHFFGQTYNVKNPDKLINELKILSEKYGINNFEFTDDCISPAYLKIFSEKLIASGLKIHWYCDLRLENAFTKELLELAYKAGLRMVLWGFEAGSKRVMELINKGIDIDKRFEILKRSADAGIYNFAYIFFGFPTETYAEAIETTEAALNTDIIHAFGTGRFALGIHSMINFNTEKFGITKIDDGNDFAGDAKFTMKESLTDEEFLKIGGILAEGTSKNGRNPVWKFLFYRELLFLYIVKYGRDAVLRMDYNEGLPKMRIAPEKSYL